MLNLNVEVLDITGRQFKGIASINSVEFAIEGAFDLEFDGSYPIVTISHNEIQGLRSLSSSVNLQDLIDTIQATDDGTWYYEHMNKLSETYAQ